MSSKKTVKKKYNIENVRRVSIPNDNKCFFHCVNQACFNGTATVEQLKDICARTVMNDKFYLPFLETSKEMYARNVRKPDYWGGEIEQVIFSRECAVEFVVVFLDGKDIRRVSHSGRTPNKRVYLEYCGQQLGRYTHYNLFVHGKKQTLGVFESDDPDKELAEVLNLTMGQTSNTNSSDVKSTSGNNILSGKPQVVDYYNRRARDNVLGLDDEEDDEEDDRPNFMKKENFFTRFFANPFM